MVGIQAMWEPWPQPWTTKRNGRSNRICGKIMWTLKTIFLCIFFCPGTITTHAESINSDLQRAMDRCHGVLYYRPSQHACDFCI